MTTLTLTDHEIQALAGLLDAGVKALGLRAVKDAATLLAKLETATQSKEEATQPKQDNALASFKETPDV